MVEIFFKNTKKNRKNVKKNYFFLNTKIFLFNQLINNVLALKQKNKNFSFHFSRLVPHICFLSHFAKNI